MRDVGCIQHLGPLTNRLLGEHHDEIVSGGNGRLASGRGAQFGEDGRLGKVGDRGLVSNVTDDSDHVVVEAVATVGVRSMPESRTHSEGSECFFESVLVIIGH